MNSIITPYTERGQLNPIQGVVPNPRKQIAGCQFHPRCPAAMDVCRAAVPDFVTVQPQRRAACFLHSAASVAQTEQDS
jgi:oligopeptide/dipeptide ABC transporter ATP-binding protein